MFDDVPLPVSSFSVALLSIRERERGPRVAWLPRSLSVSARRFCHQKPLVMPCYSLSLSALLLSSVTQALRLMSKAVDDGKQEKPPADLAAYNACVPSLHVVAPSLRVSPLSAFPCAFLCFSVGRFP